MKRPGVITFELLSKEQLKQELLLYDEIWVPGLRTAYPSDEAIEEWDLDREAIAAISYLEGEGFIKEPPIDLGGPDLHRDEVTDGLHALHEQAYRALEKHYPTAKQAALEAGAAYFNIDIALSRLTSYLLWRDRQELAYPIAFPFNPIKGGPQRLTETHDILSVILKQLPVPSDDVPLEDLVAFKRDESVRRGFEKLWHWTQTMAREGPDKQYLVEEIDQLIAKYAAELKQLTHETKYDQVEVLVTTTADILEDVAKLRLGKLAKSVFDLRRKRVQAHAAELKLAGNELAYITQASRALLQRYVRS